MSLTTSRPANTIPAGFTAAELAHLVIWGARHGLEVVINPAGAAAANEVALVRWGETAASWAIRRTSGHLWLDFTADWLRQEFRGWRMEVGSVEEAAARISVDLEILHVAGSGQHHA